MIKKTKRKSNYLFDLYVRKFDYQRIESVGVAFVKHNRKRQTIVTFSSVESKIDSWYRTVYYTERGGFNF